MKLCYTPLTLADLSPVFGYIAAHSPQNARRAQAWLQAIIDLLLLHPGIDTCMLPSGAQRRRLNLRPSPKASIELAWSFPDADAAEALLCR